MHCCLPVTPSLLPLSCECRVIICHPSSVSPSWLAGVRQITYSSHTQASTQACVHVHFELMKIQLHPRLSNGPNNGESLGASRMSGGLQDAYGLDGQVLGSDTPTPSHANAQHSTK